MSYGYTGQVLRVDLTDGACAPEKPADSVYRTWLGGTGLGNHYLTREVSPEIAWDHPENRVILATGPLAGTRVPGSGVLSAVTRGPMTGGACATQANGFYGINLKSCGWDAVIFQGIAPDWVYLYVHGGGAEIRDARSLLGLDTWEVGDALKAETGENCCRFAALVGDRGHVAAHGGIWAVRRPAPPSRRSASSLWVRSLRPVRTVHWQPAGGDRRAPAGTGRRLGPPAE